MKHKPGWLCILPFRGKKGGSDVIIWRQGTVLRVVEEEKEVQWLEVREEGGKEEQAVHYPFLFGRCEPGDRVWLNTTAVRLGLGTGGVHFVGGLVDRPPRPEPVQGHMMKLRYTPWQVALATGEEPGSRYSGLLKERHSLDGAPVLIGELHSMLPVAVATWRDLSGGDTYPRIVYVMTDGGALPAPFSRHIRMLKGAGWLTGTVTCGHAFGGDLEAVNLYSGLLLARHALKADLIFVSMGPGIVGTGTPFGFSGVEQGQAINGVYSLQGLPVVIPRIQSVDPRRRHRGLSHHTVTNLASVALAPAVVPLPQPLPAEILGEIGTLQERCRVRHHWLDVPVTVGEVENRLLDYPGKVRSMGRGVREDPLFYRTVSAAAAAAFQLWKLIGAGWTAADATAHLMSTGVRTIPATKPAPATLSRRS